jgi:hypothetical protein
MRLVLLEMEIVAWAVFRCRIRRAESVLHATVFLARFVFSAKNYLKID